MHNFIGYLTFVFVGFTILNRILEGTFFSTTDITILHELTITRPIEVFNLFSVPIPNLSFFTKAIPKLVEWDYSFFGGYFAFIQYFLYAFTAAIAFLCFTLVIGLLYQYFTRTK